MATYDELSSLANGTLRKKVMVALTISAQAALTASPGSAQQRAWALQVLQNPTQWGQTVLFAVLAANKDATVAQITAATDAQIQGNVDSIVDAIANGMAGV